MDQEPQSLPLGLDTEVDGSVDFTALSVLPTIHGSSKVAGGRRPPVPVAGSRDWLSSMVEVGRQEVRELPLQVGLETCGRGRPHGGRPTIKYQPVSGAQRRAPHANILDLGATALAPCSKINVVGVQLRWCSFTYFNLACSRGAAPVNLPTLPSQQRTGNNASQNAVHWQQRPRTFPCTPTKRSVRVRVRIRIRVRTRIGCTAVVLGALAFIERAGQPCLLSYPPRYKLRRNCGTRVLPRQRWQIHGRRLTCSP